MPLIRTDQVGPDEIPGYLYGDDKIRAALREADRIGEEIRSLVREINEARFGVDPPDMQRVEETLRRLRLLREQLGPAIGDIAYFLSPIPADEAAAARRAEERLRQLRTMSGIDDDAGPVVDR